MLIIERRDHPLVFSIVGEMLLDLLVDAYLLCNMALQFVSWRYDGVGTLITDASTLRENYMGGWFVTLGSALTRGKY